MSVHHDQHRENILQLVAADGSALSTVEERYRRDPDIVLAALANNPEALLFAAPELRKSRGFAVEAVALAWQALELLPEALQADRAVVRAAARHGPDALRMVQNLVPSAAPDEVPEMAVAKRYEGESLRLVGYCSKWRTSDARLRFTGGERIRAPSVVDGATRHELTAQLREGCLSFQVISCIRKFSFRIFPAQPGRDGFFRLVAGDPSKVAAVVGGEGDGHGQNFFIDERASATVTIFVEIAEGGGEAAVWYEPCPGRQAEGELPLLSQAPGRQKPKFLKRDDESPPRKSEAPRAAPRKPPSAAEEVSICPDVGGKAEFADLILEARALSKKTFDRRFYIRDLVGCKHLTLAVGDAGAEKKRFLGYCLCDGYFPDASVWIEHLAIQKEERGKGLGKLLVRWAGLWALAGGCRALRLSALPSAVPFYKALGFELMGSKDKDMDRMELKLSKAQQLLWGR